jgi:hypothetical protein
VSASPRLRAKSVVSCRGPEVGSWPVVFCRPPLDERSSLCLIPSAEGEEAVLCEVHGSLTDLSFPSRNVRLSFDSAEEAHRISSPAGPV